MTRRSIFAAALALVLATAGAAAAEPARVMVPASPGGGWDTTARQTMNAMQQGGIFTEGAQYANKGGAGGTIGLAEFVNQYKGQDNGLMFMGAIMVGGILTNKSPVRLDQVTPIARLTTEYNAIAVPNNSPFKTVKDFVDALKKDPGAVAVGGGSAGGMDHITLALVAKEAGVPAGRINYVPYTGGGEMIAALAGGKLAAAISGISEFKQYVDSGRVRLLAVTSDEKRPGVNAPTLKEQGINVSVGNWRGVVGAPDMPAAARRQWIERFDKLHESGAWKEVLQKQGWEDAYLSGDRFAQFIKSEQARIGGVLQEVGLVK
jgi:putative tricarboxylic transport membrane protein